MTTEVPIIFIPGILSSQLYLPENGKKLWLSPSFLKNADRMAISSPLDVRNNEINQQTVPHTRREKGMMMREVVLIERLCGAFPDRPVYYFSYDWRSCKDGALKFAEFIAYLRTLGYDTVDLVCHSMGGLVMSYYVSRHGFEHLRKIICLGVPFEGSPLMEKLAVTGDINAIPNAVAEVFGLTREIVTAYPSAAAMLPTKEYLSVFPLYRKGTPLSLEETEGIFEKCMPEVFSAARTFQRAVHRRAYKALLENPDCYFGIGIGKDTAQTVSLEGEDTVIEYMGAAGDRDVPEYSATMCGRVEKTGFERCRKFDARHSELLRSAEPMNWVISVLGDTKDPVKYEPRSVKYKNRVRKESTKRKHENKRNTKTKGQEKTK